MFDIQMIIGDQIFCAKLYENETAAEWMRQLPEDPQRAMEVHPGELMLESFNCLVLIYQNFKTWHSYTPLGYIEDTRELEKALGDKNVAVRFAAA